MEIIDNYTFSINDPVVFQISLVIIFAMMTWSWLISEWLTRKIEKWLANKKVKKND